MTEQFKLGKIECVCAILVGCRKTLSEVNHEKEFEDELNKITETLYSLQDKALWYK